MTDIAQREIANTVIYEGTLNTMVSIKIQKFFEDIDGGLLLEHANIQPNHNATQEKEDW